jgi:hypothetical protein
MTDTSLRPAVTWSATVSTTLRRLSATTAAGGLLGVLVGGVGGRLAMMLLARLNPEVTGRTSDDGFVIGQLTTETLGLLLLTSIVGAVGGGVYFLVRGLMIGPRWFQVLSVAAGAGAVVGSLLVHPDGIDFTLEPVWLAIALFVAIPFVYAACLTLLAERWLRPGTWFTGASIWVAVTPLLLWLPIAPVLLLLLTALAVVEAVRRAAAGTRASGTSTWPWVARCALAGVFVVAVLDLAGDVAVLT